MRKISILLVLIIISEPLLLNAEGVYLPAVAVYPSAKSESLGRAASDLGAAISQSGCCHVVDNNLVDDVAKYHRSKIKNQNLSDEANQFLSQAKEAYFGFKYKDARDKVERAISVFRARGYQSSGKDLLDALLLRALTAKALREPELIPSLANEMVKINPLIDLESGKLPPTLAAEIERSRNVLFDQGVGSLKIKGNVPAAEIYINGIALGSSPAEIKRLPVGQYLVTFKATNYNNYSQMVGVASGKTSTVRGKLAWTEKGDKSDEADIITEGARLAGLLKVDKLIMLEENSQTGILKAQMIDRKFSVAHRPYEIKNDADDYPKNLVWLADKLSAQAYQDVSLQPVTKIAGLSSETPAEFFSTVKKPFYKKPLFWTGVGVLVAGALGAGLAIGFGGGSSSDTGDLRVRIGASVGR